MRTAMNNNGLTPTMVLRFLNSQLGSAVQTIELTEQEMMRIVFQQSLPTFSQYFPFLPIVELSDKDRINGSYTEFRIPNEWHLKLLSLHKWYLNSETNYSGGWIAPFVTNPVDEQILSDSLSSFITPLLINYIAPNKLVILQNYYNAYGYVSVQFKAVHPNHMKTIQPNMRDDFLHLCLYDVLLSLYPIRHRFSTISTPYGSLEPFFELVDSAKDNRDALISRWRETYLYSGDQKKIWIA